MLKEFVEALAQQVRDGAKLVEMPLTGTNSMRLVVQPGQPATAAIAYHADAPPLSMTACDLYCR